MRNSVCGICVLLTTLLAEAVVMPAKAIEVGDDLPLLLRGRFESVVEVDRGSQPFGRNHRSRSPEALTLLTLDLRFSDDRYGLLYLRGDARWRLADAATGQIPFSFEQADYFWERSHDFWAIDARVFANERRFFTGEAGVALIDDDRIDSASDYYGLRINGERRNLHATLLGSTVDNGASGTRDVLFARTGWRGRHAQASVSYLRDAPEPDSLDAGTVARAEVVGFFRGATVVVSHEQSGLDSFPSGRFHWGDWDGANYTEIMPASGATFAEVRLGRISIPRALHLNVVARYRAVGTDYRNDLSSDTRGEVSQSVGIYGGHNRLVADGRLVYQRRRRGLTGLDVKRLEASARGMFRNGGDVFLRSAIGQRRDAARGEVDERFVHAGIGRDLRKFRGGLYAMVFDTDARTTGYRWGVDMRVNAGASMAFYGRLIQNEEAVTSDALYVRVEFRPLTHVFATAGYGRQFIGDAPFVLEDADIGNTGLTDNVYTITIRGDF